MPKSIIQQKRELPQSSPVFVQPSIADNAIMRKIGDVDAEWKKTIEPRLVEDEKLWTKEPYELRDSKGDKLEDVEHVTILLPRITGTGQTRF